MRFIASWALRSNDVCIDDSVGGHLVGVDRVTIYALTRLASQGTFVVLSLLQTCA